MNDDPTDLQQPEQPSAAELAAEREAMLTDLNDRLDAIDAARGNPDPTGGES